MLISTMKLRGKYEICVGSNNDSAEIGRENKRSAEQGKRKFLCFLYPCLLNVKQYIDNQFHNKTDYKDNEYHSLSNNHSNNITYHCKQ